MVKKVKSSTIIRKRSLQDHGVVKTDSKNRVCLKGPVSALYRLYRNDIGQILLDPQLRIPPREAWLFKNKKALASVLRGLKEAGEGKLVKMKSFAGE